MKIENKHKVLLKELGLNDRDLELFDGDLVRYEYNEEKGVRIYDPYYHTSYNEYIGIDGWSAWSEEKDTFMSNILGPAKKEAERREAESKKPEHEEIAEELKKKFAAKDDREEGPGS